MNGEKGKGRVSREVGVSIIRRVSGWEIFAEERGMGSEYFLRAITIRMRTGYSRQWRYAAVQRCLVSVPPW